MTVTFADSTEKVGLGGEPLSHHDIVVALELEEFAVAVTILPVGKDSFEVASAIVLLLGLEEDVPILDVQLFNAVRVVQLGELFNVAGEYLALGLDGCGTF